MTKLHMDQIRDLAREFQAELLHTGVEQVGLGRMIERAIDYAEKCGTHMPIQEVWLAAGGNPGITPDKEEVVAALRAMDQTIDECAEQPRSAATVTGWQPPVSDDILNAIAAYGDARADNVPNSAEKIGDVVQLIRASYGALINRKMQQNQPTETLTLDAIGVEIDDKRGVWVAQDNGRTLIKFRNGELETGLLISEAASTSLLMLLLETHFPGWAKEKDDKPEGNGPQSGSHPTDFQEADLRQIVPVIPEELMKISRLLHTQDNRATDQPMFVVEQKRGVISDASYNDCRVEWCETESGDHALATPLRAQRLEALYQARLEEPDGWKRFEITDVWEFVTACMTEKGCEDHLAANRHNLNEPRIYAYGSYRNYEFQTLRKWLMSLTAAPEKEMTDAACR